MSDLEINEPFQRFCEVHGVSGVLLWAAASTEREARPVTGFEVAAKTLPPVLRATFAQRCHRRLDEFNGWMKSVLDSSQLRV